MANTSEMTGRRVLITGATSGIGRAAAERIAAMGADVTLVGRNPERTAQAVEAIRRTTGNASVDHRLADLSVMAQVKRLADEVKRDFDALHVLINNAGAMFTRRHQTADGYEKTLALNHLAYVLLTRELLPLLQRSSPARVVNVASGAHAGGTIDFDDLHTRARRYRPLGVYSQSKLANILFTYELDRRLEGGGVTVNCVHPGFVRTRFGKNDGWWMKLGVTIAGLFGRSPEKGSDGIVYLATSPDVEGVSGQYYMDHSPRRSSRESRDEAVAKRLWEVSEKLVDEALEAAEPAARQAP